MSKVELTRVLTLEITFIEMEENLEPFTSKEKSAEKAKNLIKNYLDADDVLVTNVQDFVRDIK